MSYQANREVKAGLRKEQGRLLAQNEHLIIRDVSESPIIVNVLLWFFNQSPNLRDEILGDMKQPVASVEPRELAEA